MGSFVLGITYSVVATVVWGLNSYIMKTGARTEHPMYALFLRAIVAFPLLTVLTLVIRDYEAITVYLTPFMLAMVFLLVVSIIVGDGIYIYALKLYPVNLVLPIASIYPLITTTILIVGGIENVGLFVNIGTLIIITGIGIVTSNGSFAEGFPMKALVLGVGVAFGWGSSVVIATIILNQEGTESFGLMMFRTIFIGTFGLMLFARSTKNRQEYYKKPVGEKKRGAFYMGISGIFGWVIGATVMFLAIEEIGASIPTPITSTNPIIAAIIGYFTGMEEISRLQFLGICLSTLGVVLIVIF